MTWLRSLIFNACFFALTGVLAVASVPLLLVDRHGLRRMGIFWARATLLLLRVVVGARLEVRGGQLFGGRVVAAKHQSAIDTMLFYLLASDPAYVMKAELMAVPIYGRLSRHQKMIVVDRKGGASALKRMMRDAQDAVDAGRQIVIFPQGTRTAPGADASAVPYQPGVAALYQALKLPVTPVALNSGIVWGRRSFAKRSGTIIVEILPDIPAGLPRAEFMRTLEAAIEGATSRLEAEGTRGG
ncbi:MAG: 1-acyl-sn-glycerol-3-phosphate acyltransferase [Alphaproteobacteria bacterium]|nr:1-acyl-sn-glycerol-3-phosphate acyltransferase [Alphaproteobacteria bacterium]